MNTIDEKIYRSEKSYKDYMFDLLQKLNEMLENENMTIIQKRDELLKMIEMLGKTFYYSPYKDETIKSKLSDQRFLLHSKSYIIPELPKDIEQDEFKVAKVLSKLKKGITHQEAEILLNWISHTTRENLKNCLKIDLKESSLIGCCGYSQRMNGVLLEKIGLLVSYHHSSFFEGLNHFFLITYIPIQEQNHVVYTPYLLDYTFRQFFSTVRCSIGNFYYDEMPTCGYYAMKDETKYNVAETILKNGYIKVTEKNIKAYCDLLALPKIGFQTFNKERESCLTRTNMTGTDYLKILRMTQEVHQKQTEEDYLEQGAKFDLPKVKKYVSLYTRIKDHRKKY